ncbi:MAG: hypothetical protein LAN36_15040 [Acidobacteriia bacterium]|nr:hypothetical protein [Terriglobia bacterium]
MDQAIRLRFDSTEFKECLKLDRPHLGDVALKFVYESLGIVETPEKFFCLQTDSCAAIGANELGISLNPTDFLRGYVAAISAFDRYFALVKEGAHAESDSTPSNPQGDARVTKSSTATDSANL